MKKNIFLILNKLYSGRSDLDLSAETIKISISVEKYDEKTAENYLNCYVAEKQIIFKLSKISIRNFNSSNCRLA